MERVNDAESSQLMLGAFPSQNECCSSVQNLSGVGLIFILQLAENRKEWNSVRVCHPSVGENLFPMLHT